MKTAIVTDSNSGITQEEAKVLGIFVLPMPFMIDGEDYYEDINLTQREFYEKLKDGSDISTSQPSPESVTRLWDKVLKEYDALVHIPMSRGLSGSCQTARMLAREAPYEGRVFVVDNGRVATPQHRSVLDAWEMIQEGYGAAQIQAVLEEYRDKMNIYVGVETLEHLKRGGRISAATAAIGSILKIKPVLEFDVGTLETYRKCRGMEKARKTMVEAVRHDFATRFREWVDKGKIYLLAASSAADTVTEGWVAEIRQAFPGMEVMCDDLSLGVSCHIGQGGLGIGYSCRPERPVQA